ncbi:hypothetical protein NP233_g11160 [Leucocoprinus birnbaumii]|uniref:BTB domain-containing protein n=1 Tax=Leucocoprinus birnbaumii TaxID=56174 RepID=A0AAD5VHK6_9AGAR|nr:hypothetical protein NP233_g11160 [Leucocoprinus birnbaumii]
MPNDPLNQLPQKGPYHIRGGDLYIQVEQFLFRVHSYFFLRESNFWRNELDGPVTANNHRDDAPLKIGNNAATRYILKDVKAADFTKLLGVFYNRNYGDFSKAKGGDWIAILRLAGKWDFHEIKELAVEHLKKHTMELSHRVRLYEENQVDGKHLFPLYVQLSSREEVFGLEEARVLGIETFVLVQQARERLRGQASPSDPMQNPLPPGIQRPDIRSIVAATFNIPLPE